MRLHSLKEKMMNWAPFIVGSAFTTWLLTLTGPSTVVKGLIIPSLGYMGGLGTEIMMNPMRDRRKHGASLSVAAAITGSLALSSFLFFPESHFFESTLIVLSSPFLGLVIAQITKAVTEGNASYRLHKSLQGSLEGKDDIFQAHIQDVKVLNFGRWDYNFELNLDDKGYVLVAKQLENSNIAKIIFDYQKIQNQSFISFIQGLKIAPKMRALSLEGCFSDLKEAGVVLEELNETTVCALNLSSHRIKSIDQITSLAPPLGISLLKSLAMRNCDLKDAGVEALAKALNKHQMIEVDLQSNNISDKGAIAFVQEQQGSRLNRINFSQNDITVQGADALVALIERSSLTQITLDFLHKKLEEALERNKRRLFISPYFVACLGYYPENGRSKYLSKEQAKDTYGGGIVMNLPHELIYHVISFLPLMNGQKARKCQALAEIKHDQGLQLGFESSTGVDPRRCNSSVKSCILF